MPAALHENVRTDVDTSPNGRTAAEKAVAGGVSGLDIGALLGIASVAWLLGSMPFPTWASMAMLALAVLFTGASFVAFVNWLGVRVQR